MLQSVLTGLEALRANPLRTVLSTLGVIIGVAALVAVGGGIRGHRPLDRTGLRYLPCPPRLPSIPRRRHPTRVVQKTVINTLNLILLAMLIGLSILAFDQLPDRIPLHYGADGIPDRWGTKSWISWMLLPMVAAALSAMMYWLAAWIRARPEKINTPNPKLFDGLSPEHKMQVVDQQVDLMAVITLGMNILFAALQWGSYQSATGQSEGLPWATMALIGVFLVFALLVGIRGVMRSNTLIKELSATA